MEVISNIQRNPKMHRLNYFLVLVVLLQIFAQIKNISAQANQAGNDTDSGKLSSVQTKNGALEGKLSKSRSGNDFHEFLGIPYGQVKVRFQPAVEAEKWEGVKKATKFGSPCVQVSIEDPNKVIGKEDCLFLNVYSPKLNSTDKLPVMVFIHGGGYFLGRGDEYGPNYIIDHNVVLVTLNYRLGPFGFLNAGIEEAGGNMGLKDQVLALKWIKENIDGFGGDSSRVTIFGESSGASSVSLLTLSPLAEGLFQNAISQSGTALCPITFENNPLTYARKLAFSVDCPTRNAQYMVECLRKIEPGHLLENIKCAFLLEETPRDPTYTSQFFPSVETYSNDSTFKKLLPQHPYKILKEGNFKAVPYIIGLNDAEGLINSGLILQSKNITKRVNEEWGKIIPSTFSFEDKTKDTCVVSSKLKEFYLSNEEVSNETRDGFENMHTDRWYLHSSKLMASLYSQYAPTYLYNFTFRGNNSFADMLNIPSDDPNSKRPTHFDEIQYQFNYEHIPPIGQDSPYYSFSEKFIQLWASFAKNGKPTDLWGLEDNQQWSPLDSNKTAAATQWLKIDKNTAVVDEHPSVTQRFEFWENLPILENAKAFPDKADKSEL